jgi:hypothetical protein
MLNALRRAPSTIRRAGTVCCVLVGLSALDARSAAAQNVVIDFEDLACGGTGANTFAGPYLSSGFSFASSSTNGFGNWCTGSPHFPGSTAMGNNAFSGITYLTKIGGGAFSLFSMKLAQLYYGSFAAQSILFTGILPNSSLVFQTFTIAANSGTPVLTQFQFTNAFRNVTQVSWSQGAVQVHQFDDVNANLTAIPEPITMSLLAIGLVGVAGVGYLRQRRNR